MVSFSYYQDDQLLDQTFVNQKKALRSETKKMRKIGVWETYFALLKGYCALVIIILPKAFLSGGYLFSAFCIMLSGIITTKCAIKLVDCGLKTKLMCYPSISKLAMGKNFRTLVEVMIALTQYSFTIS